MPETLHDKLRRLPAAVAQPALVALTPENLSRLENPNRFIGVALEVNDGVAPGSSPVSRSYIIRGVENFPEKQRQLVQEGNSKFYRTGTTLNFGKKPKAHIAVEEQPHFIIDKFTPFGELQDVLVYTPSELESFIRNNDTANVGVEASPDKHESPAGSHKEVQVQLTGNEENTFDEISRQLEDHHIYNWGEAKVSWEYQGHRFEVDRETIITERVGLQAKPVRAFLIRECGADGRPIAYRVLKDDALMKDYFDNHKGRISNLTAKKSKTKEDLVDKTLPIPEYYLNGILNPQERTHGRDSVDIIPEYETSQMKKTREKQEALRKAGIEKNNAALENDIAKQMADAPETIAKEDRVAAWLLSYADTVNPSDEEAGEKRRAKLEEFAKVADTEEGKRRIETLKEVIDEHGVFTVYMLATKLKNDFLVAARILHLPVGFIPLTGTSESASSSISWAVEGLADEYYYSKHPDKTGKEHKGLRLVNPFGRTLEAELGMRDIVDQRVGSALTNQTISISKNPEVVGVENKQLIYEIKEKTQHDTDPLQKLQKHIREQAKMIDQEIYKDVTRVVEERNTLHEAGKEVIHLAYLTMLGRLLRRSIGQ
jgi:hypothetical protein